MELLVPSITASLLLVYSVIITQFYLRWRKAAEFVPRETNQPKISVVVPFHHETQNLHALVDDILNQDYEPGGYELILVNDSQSKVSDLLRKKCALGRSVSIESNPYQKGKKYALLAGIHKAGNSHILLTDSDCRVPKTWIRMHAGFHLLNPGLKLVSAGVLTDIPDGFFSTFMALEFSSLVSSGAAGFFAGKPLLCNGANLSFPKDIFKESFEKLKPGIPSGDDIFLMEFVDKRYKAKVGFIKSREAFVCTRTPDTWSSFFRQRLRWVSKSLHYSSPRLIAVSVLVFLVNLSLLITLALSFWQPFAALYFAGFIMLKSIPDYLLLSHYLNFIRQPQLLKIFLPSQLCMPFFIPFSAFAGWMQGVFRIKK